MGGGLVDILPLELRDHGIEPLIAALRPEGIGRAIVGRFQRVIGRAQHAAKGAEAAAQAATVILARGEEGMPRPLPAILGQEHAFGTIEDLGQIVARARKGRREIVGMILQRCAGRGADDPAAIEGHDEDRARIVAIAGQIAPFMGRIAIVETGPVAEHPDAQRGQIVEGGLDLRPRQHPEIQAHFTCLSQSARL